MINSLLVRNPAIENYEEVRRKLYIVQIQGARVTNANNRMQLSESQHVLFPNPHMQTTPEPKMQSTLELKK